jgi:hypothetical protein
MKNYGLQFDKIQEQDYYLGGGFIGTQEVQPNGQWDAFLPPEEIQNTNDVETMNCTVFGTINAIEILFNKLFYEARSFSERFVGVLANTNPSGNSPHVVAETIRKNGLIDDTELPFDETIDTWDKYYSPKPMIRKYLKQGKIFLQEYEFKHEWVFKTGSLEEKIVMIKEALKRGPVGASVYAWSCDENGIYYKAGPENHWICIYGFREDIHCWKVFDSYTQSYKLYSFYSDISMAKVYWLKKTGLRHSNLWLSLFHLLFDRFII